MYTYIFIYIYIHTYISWMYIIIYTSIDAKSSASSVVWHDSSYVTLRSSTCHVSFICAVTHSYMTWLNHMWHDSLIYDMTHSYLYRCHELREQFERLHILCVLNNTAPNFLIGKHVRHHILPRLWLDSFIRDMTLSHVTWLVHMWHDSWICDMTHSHPALPHSHTHAHRCSRCISFEKEIQREWDRVRVYVIWIDQYVRHHILPCLFVCVRERAWERERVCVCVCVFMCVHVCVCERERVSECDCECVCVCVCVCGTDNHVVHHILQRLPMTSESCHIYMRHVTHMNESCHIW